MYPKEIFLILGMLHVLCLAVTEPSLEDVNDVTDSDEIGEEPLDSSSTRGIVGDIAKIRKVVEVIETVGEKIIPAIIESQSDKPIRFKLLKALKSDNKDDTTAPQD